MRSVRTNLTFLLRLASPFLVVLLLYLWVVASGLVLWIFVHA